MARITVEDCLVQENNRFALVQLASKRTKQLLQGSSAQITDRRNKSVVTALREIADGCVRFMTAEETQAYEEEQARIAEEEKAARLAQQQPAKEVGSGLFGEGADTSSLDFLRETLMQPGPVSANGDESEQEDIEAAAAPVASESSDDAAEKASDEIKEDAPLVEEAEKVEEAQKVDEGEA